MVESPALIRPYIKALTRSELFIVMSVGMATIAGTVMVLYSVGLDSWVGYALSHMITASVISAPAAIMLALIMVPATSSDSADDFAKNSKDFGPKYHNIMDAIAKGTGDGIALMVNVGAVSYTHLTLPTKA